MNRRTNRSIDFVKVSIPEDPEKANRALSDLVNQIVFAATATTKESKFYTVSRNLLSRKPRRSLVFVLNPEDSGDIRRIGVGYDPNSRSHLVKYDYNEYTKRWQRTREEVTLRGLKKRQPY